MGIPVTDSGVSLISLSTDSPDVNNNSMLELPQTPPVNETVVNIPSMGNVPQEPSVMTMGQPLVSFTGANSQPVEEPVKETVKENSFINLNDNNVNNNNVNNNMVSFNNSPQMTGVSGSNSNSFNAASSALPHISSVPSNVSSAPDVNKTGFIKSSVDEEIIDGTSSSDSGAQVPGLQFVNMLGGQKNENVSNVNVNSMNNEEHDTFAKPDLSMNNNFNNSGMGNNMIPSIPSNLNMANDLNSRTPLEPSGNTLVNFIENM